ncbi:hypothetical protein ES703_90202 [subsurface metagenome]
MLLRALHESLTPPAARTYAYQSLGDIVAGTRRILRGREKRHDAISHVALKTEPQERCRNDPDNPQQQHVSPAHSPKKTHAQPGNEQYQRSAKVWLQIDQEHGNDGRQARKEKGDGAFQAFRILAQLPSQDKDGQDLA